jgi:hypothetical protein
MAAATWSAAKALPMRVHVVPRRGRLQAMSWLGSASDVSELIAAVASPVVAGIAIAANLRATRYVIDDKREERLWDRRADLYVDLIRLIEREGRQDTNDLWMTADTLDKMPNTYWQTSRDRDPQSWQDNQVRVSAYASDRVFVFYADWEHDLLRLAAVVQPPRVTGMARPADLPAALRKAVEAVDISVRRLRNQIRLELQPAPVLPRKSRRLRRPGQPA